MVSKREALKKKVNSQTDWKMGHANVDDSGGLRNRKTIVQGNTMKEAVTMTGRKERGGERALLRFQGKRKHSEEEM